MKRITIKLVKFLVSIIILNNGIINPNYAESADERFNVNNIKRYKIRHAIELSAGSFHRGPYAPYQIDKNTWNKCNTLNFCNLNNLFGKNIGLTYINRLYENNSHRVDIDGSITFNSQDYRSTRKNFLMLSIVPTYRYYPKNYEERINLGIGAGINLSSRVIPSKSNDNENLNTQ